VTVELVVSHLNREPAVNLDNFGMDTITLAAPWRESWAPSRGGFTQIMLSLAT